MFPAALLLAALPLASLPQDAVPTPAAAVSTLVAQPLFTRIHVVGASFSNGYGLDKELVAATSLARVIDAFPVAEAPAAKSHGSFWFYEDPVGKGAEQVKTATQDKPTLVFALDFLFWYAYGEYVSDKHRDRRLEVGLRVLEGFECPLVVGDIPDMSVAKGGYSELLKGPLMYSFMIPSAEQQDAMNTRIRAWAAGHENVIVAPLAEYVRKVQRGEGLQLGEARLPKRSFGRMVQKDLLHPSVEGAIALATIAFHALDEAREDLLSTSLRWDQARLRDRLMELTEPQREAARARRARRDARLERMRKRREAINDKDGR